MNKIAAYNWSQLAQSLLDIAIKVSVAAVLLLLDAVTKALSKGTIQLPYEAVSLPILTLVLAQFDSVVVAWQAKQVDTIPVPAPNV